MRHGCVIATAWCISCVYAAMIAAMGAQGASLPFLDELCGDCADCVSGMQTSRRDGRTLGKICVCICMWGMPRESDKDHRGWNSVFCLFVVGRLVLQWLDLSRA